MKFKHTHFFVLFLIVSMVNGLLAQMQQEGYVSLDFKTMAWDKYDDATFFYRSSNDENKVFPRKLRRSKPEHYYGPENLVFYKKVKGPEGQTIRQPVASVTLSSGTKDPLLLFIKNPNPEAEQPYVVWVIDDSNDDFPFGAYQIFNLSGQEIRGEIDGNAYSLPSNGSHTIVQLSGDRRNVMAGTQVKWKGEWKTVTTSTWSYNPNRRSIVFLLMSKNPEYGFFDMKIIPESRRSNDFDIAVVPEDNR